VNFRDRGAVDEIAVGRAGASAASQRVTRGTSQPPRTDRGAVALYCEREATQKRQEAVSRDFSRQEGYALLDEHGVAYDERFLWD